MSTLRIDLERVALQRRSAEEQRRAATRRAAELLRRVGEDETITMREAAAILGVSRVRAYRIMEEAPKQKEP